MRLNAVTPNFLATKMNEERSKLPPQRDSLDDASMKQRFGENMGQLLDQNHASSLLKSAAVAAGLPSAYAIFNNNGKGCMVQLVLCRLHFKPGINNFQDLHQI